MALKPCVKAVTATGANVFESWIESTYVEMSACVNEAEVV